MYILERKNHIVKIFIFIIIIKKKTNNSTVYKLNNKKKNDLNKYFSLIQTNVSDLTTIKISIYLIKICTFFRNILIYN